MTGRRSTHRASGRAAGEGPRRETRRETQRARRGHGFYPPAMSVDPWTGRAVPMPALYATERQPAAQKVLHVHYFVGGCDWWVAEYDPATGTAFGYACLGDPDLAEWGYVDLPELEALTVHGGLVVVERDLHWRPVPAGRAQLPGRRTW